MSQGASSEDEGGGWRFLASRVLSLTVFVCVCLSSTALDTVHRRQLCTKNVTNMADIGRLLVYFSALQGVYVYVTAGKTLDLDSISLLKHSCSIWRCLFVVFFSVLFSTTITEDVTTDWISIRSRVAIFQDFARAKNNNSKPLDLRIKLQAFSFRFINVIVI